MSIVDGNAVTRDLVARGGVPVGFTDTDDAYVAIQAGKPVRMIFPDKEGIGTLLIPNTVALIQGGPNPQEGKKLIDYLLSQEVESTLAFGESRQMPVRDGVKAPPELPAVSSIRAMQVDYHDIARNLERAARFCQQLFVR
jgi:iron(III) transport system substrate-binding protein